MFMKNTENLEFYNKSLSSGLSVFEESTIQQRVDMDYKYLFFTIIFL